ncbi:MAG TPA: hypothetical protein VGD43_08675 [Micromonospora sp.]
MATRWVPVSRLPVLARALLSDDLGGRDAVPRHVADRVTAEARKWAGYGFTEQTVGPWKDLPPAAAAYLAGRQVDPRGRDLPMGVTRTNAPVVLKLAIASGLLPVEQAYELLVATGEHVPVPAGLSDAGPARPRPAPVPVVTPLASPVPPPPPVSAPPRRPVSLVVFSHAADEHQAASSAS